MISFVAGLAFTGSSLSGLNVLLFVETEKHGQCHLPVDQGRRKCVFVQRIKRDSSPRLASRGIVMVGRVPPGLIANSNGSIESIKLRAVAQVDGPAVYVGL